MCCSVCNAFASSAKDNPLLFRCSICSLNGSGPLVYSIVVKKKTYLERADLMGSEVSMLLQKYELFPNWQIYFKSNSKFYIQFFLNQCILYYFLNIYHCFLL